MNAEALFTDIDQCPSVPPLLLSIRNGSGEDWRASVQDRRGRRSGFVCTSKTTTLSPTETTSVEDV